MLRSNTRFLLIRAEVASVELRRLLPLLPSSGQGSPLVAQSVASVIVSTAFSSTLKHLPGSHSRDCPVKAKLLPLSRVGIEPSFASRPCINCVRERVHYLASVVFCEYFEQRCTGTAATSASGKRELAQGSTKLLEKEVEASFGSLSALKESLQQLSHSTMSPGRLWIVYSPTTADQPRGSVNVLSLPGCKVPLAHGLWPLAVVNLSEERICDELERCAGSRTSQTAVSAAAQPPAWSHAARTPSAAATVLGSTEHTPRGLASERIQLGDLQAAVAARALNAMNWIFVEDQLASALAYYNSAERVNTRQGYRRGKEQLAAVRAMSRLKDSGAVIHAADSVTISSSQPITSAAEGAKESATSSTATTEIREVAAQEAAGAAAASDSASAFSTAPAAEDKFVRQASSFSREVSPAVPAAAAGTGAALGPRPVQQADGTWEYHYDNGDITTVRKDGTKIFQAKELTTTVYSNGDTLFEYPNNTSILDRADGMRVTTYADGTKKEERLR